MENILKKNESFNDFAEYMTEEYPKALNALINMLHEPNYKEYLLLCDKLGIRGKRLSVLDAICCNSDAEKFTRTLNVFQNQTFSIQEIQENLDSDNTIPFIDDSIEYPGISPKKISIVNKEDWDEYCKSQRELFELKKIELESKKSR